MKIRESRPLREHFEVSTDAGEALRTFDYIEELEAYINHLEALRQPAVRCLVLKIKKRRNLK